MNNSMKTLRIVLGGLLFSLSTVSYADDYAISGPQTINFNNNDEIKIQLSDDNPNALSVAGDKITNVICTTGICSVKNDPADLSGTAYLSLMSTSVTTAFITTKQERHFSLLITPFDEPGKTIIFNPQDGAAMTATFEQASDYETLLIGLDKAIIKGELPDGYGTQDVSKMKAITLKSGLVLQPDFALVGQVMSAIKFTLSNPTDNPITIIPQQFYRPGVRAVSVVNQKLEPKGTGFVYEIISSGEQQNG